MTESDLIAAMKALFPGAILAQEVRGHEWMLSLAPAHLVDVCEFLRDQPEAQYDLFATMTVTGDRLYYQLVSLSQRRRLGLRVPVPRGNPDGEPPTIGSLAFIWPAANWAEREARDFFAVSFQGHPDPRPLLVGADPPPDLSPRGKLLHTGTRYPTSLGDLFIRIRLDELEVIDAQPELGYHHSGLEQKLASWPYERGAILAARMDGFSAMQGDLVYALAVEKLLRLEPPPRAQWLRVIYAELQRVASHLFWLGRSVQNVVDPPFVAPAYVWEARRQILDLFQWLGGNPITPDVIAIGGLCRDAPPTLTARLSLILADLQALLEDLDLVLAANETLYARLENVGVIDPGTALGLGVTGPCLRACGVGYDVRAAFPYSGYASLDVRVPVERDGDAQARQQVRLAEIRVSLGLIRDALARLPDGPVNALRADGLAPGSAVPAPPPGTTYVSIEGARGELGLCLVSDGSTHPQHVHVRAPSFANLSALPYMVRGISLDQVSIVLDSLDISAGEVER